MSDLVERLRALEAFETELAHDGDCPPEATANWKHAETCREAAARIQQLEAALRDLLNASERHIFSTECQKERDAARAALGEKP